MHTVFVVASLLTGGAAVFHLVRALAPAAGDGSSPARHVLFVVIDAALAIGFWKRPTWFSIALSALVVQQLWSHGSAGLTAWRRGSFDAVSLLVVVLLPALLLLVLHERRLRHRGAAPGSPR